MVFLPRSVNIDTVEAAVGGEEEEGVVVVEGWVRGQPQSPTWQQKPQYYDAGGR